MSRCNMSVCKLCRRENTKLFLKGDRCFTDKCSFERRPYPPGQHGQARLKFSEFALQLREKQKTKRYYGVAERQFRKFFFDADKMKGQTGVNLLQRLEMRFDNVVYTSGLASSRREAKQLIRHNHFLLNGKRANMPSLQLKPGDTIEVKESSRQISRIMGAVESAKRREMPAWVQPDHAAFKGVVKELPLRETVGLPVEENMIVEYYSR